MSSIGTSPHPFTTAPTEGRGLVRFLRHPSEPLAFAACVIANVAVIAIASGLVLAGTEWLAAYPFVANRVQELRIITIAAVISFPATIIGRHVALHEARGNGVRVTAEAYPELHAELVRISRVLGVDPIPELYLGRVKGAPAAAHAVVGKPSCVVLDTDTIFDKEWREGSDWISFVLAGAIGSIRLGHTRWWVEIFTAYAKRIPGVRSPLLIAWTFSRDRCAAFAAPGAVR